MSRPRLVEIDEFMAGLWKVHLAVKKEGYAQASHVANDVSTIPWLI